MPTKNELMLELEMRLGLIKCVSPLTKSIAYQLADDALDAAELEKYLRTTLPIVERFIEPNASAEIHDFWDQLGNAHDLASLSQAFDVPIDFEPLIWMQVASYWYSRREIPRSLSAAAAMLVTPITVKFWGTPVLVSITGQIVEILGRVNKYYEALNLYEMLFGWNSDSYRNHIAIRRSLDDFAPNKILKLQVVTNVIQQCLGSCRYEDAFSVVCASLGLDAAKGLRADVFLRAVKYFLSEPIPDDMAEFPNLDSVLPSLEILWACNVAQVIRNRSTEACEGLVNLLAGIDSKLGQPSTTIEALRRKYSFPGVEQPLEILVGQLVIGLTASNRHADAVSAGEAYLGLSAGVYRSPEKLAGIVKDYVTDLEPQDGGMFLLGSLATGLRRCERAHDGAQLLEALFSAHGKGIGIEAAIQGFKHQVKVNISPDHVIGTMSSWVRCLGESGQTNLAEQVAFDALADLEWLEVSNGAVTGNLMNLITGLNELLLRCGEKNLELGAKVIPQLVRLIRSTLGDVRLGSADRLHFQEQLADMRDYAIRLGMSWVFAAADEDEREKRWRSVLCWDGELGQRGVLERFLQGAPAADLSPPVVLAELSSTTKAERASDEHGSCCLSLQESRDTERIVQQSIFCPHSGVEDLRERLAQGVEIGELADALFEGERFLRAAFAVDGRLGWGLFEKHGASLRLVTDGIGQLGDRNAILQAIKRHDAELQVAWLANHFLARTSDPTALTTAAKAVQLSLMDLESTLRERPSCAVNAWHEVAKALERNYAIDPTGIESGFREYYSFAQTATPSEDWISLRLAAAGRLAKLLEWPLSPGETRQHRDSCTEAFLREIAKVWPLAQLRRSLEASHDLVVQLDSELHSLPVSYLITDQGYLCESVGSVRCVYSLLLNKWIEHSASSSAGEQMSSLRNGMIVSWFDSTDRASITTDVLKDSLNVDACGIRWFLAEKNMGNHNAFKSALESLRPEIVIVCGHGHHYPRGVRLADGIWSGAHWYSHTNNEWIETSGGRLSGVKLLVQVSCSIGRVLGEEGTDIDGFCVETALAGGQAAIAAKWPISVHEAPKFAACVAREYAKLRLQSVSSESPRLQNLRSRSVAAARRYLRTLNTEASGLNTLAAFELYGLG